MGCHSERREESQMPSSGKQASPVLFCSLFPVPALPCQRADQLRMFRPLPQQRLALTRLIIRAFKPR